MKRNNKVRRQPNERLKRLEQPRTEFSRWRATCGFYQKEAAEALQVSESAVQSYERGTVKPTYAVRVLMRMIADRQKICDPWPE